MCVATSWFRTPWFPGTQRFTRITSTCKQYMIYLILIACKWYYKHNVASYRCEDEFAKLSTMVMPMVSNVAGGCRSPSSSCSTAKAFQIFMTNANDNNNDVNLLPYCQDRIICALPAIASLDTDLIAIMAPYLESKEGWAIQGCAEYFNATQLLSTKGLRLKSKLVWPLRSQGGRTRILCTMVGVCCSAVLMSRESERECSRMRVSNSRSLICIYFTK